MHKNEQVLRDGYAAFASGDVAAATGNFADDIVWHVSGHNPLSGDYKGVQEVMGYFAKIMETSGGTFKLDIHDVLANDEHATVLARASAQNGDKSLQQNVVHVWHMSDGKAQEYWGFTEDQKTADEFFS